MSRNNFQSAKQQIAASCSGAFLTSIFMTPLDVVKVRLQAQQRDKLRTSCFVYSNGLMDHLCVCKPNTKKQWFSKPIPVPINGTLDGLMKIGRHEGLYSLWSGLSPTLIVAVPSTVLYFTAYEQLRHLLHSHSGGPSWWAPGVAGGLARFLSVSVCSPVELIRTKMQSTAMSFRELGFTMKSEIKTKGVKSLWRGWIPNVLRDVPFSVLYWLGYEHLKRMGGQEHPSIPFTIFAGSLSGAVAATITLPMDVVKTHTQIQMGEQLVHSGSVGPKIHSKSCPLYVHSNSRLKQAYSSSTWSRSCSTNSSTTQQLRLIYQRQGFSGLFSGLTPRLAKIMPACAIMISTYEYAKRRMQLD